MNVIDGARTGVDAQRTADESLSRGIEKPMGKPELPEAEYRALVVFDLVLDLMERSGGTLTVQNPDGSTERVHLL